VNKSSFTGIDLLLDQPDKYIKGRNFALISGSSVIDSNFHPVFLSLKTGAGNYFKEIWALQHGFFVDKQDNMILSKSHYSPELQLNIKSFYNDHLTPVEEDFKAIDLILIDIFDVGTRVYTFLNHILKILKTITGRKVSILVADRPNPINGTILEGNCSRSDYFSIVSMIDIPMRHGLTVAEFISYGIDYYNLDLDIEYIRLPGWERKNFLKTPWTLPSPNMPGLNTAILYPGSVLLEGTNISEGRGTTRPFEIFGAPFIDHTELCRELKSYNSPGVDFSPIHFKPEFSKFKGQICRGILIHTINKDKVESFEIFYELLRILYHRYPDQFIFHNHPYEFEYESPAIDIICGSDFIRKSIEKNLTYQEIKPAVQRDHSDYKNRVFQFLFY
jgi:uncharacterized protein YbbC (DUF1343 family)